MQPCLQQELNIDTKLHIYKFTVMTSPCEVQIYSDDEHKARSTAQTILQMAKGLEKKYNFYDTNSYLSNLNQRKVNTLDAQTKDLLTRAKLFYAKTNGIFDITMGTLTKARQLSSTKSIRKETQRLEPFVGVEHFKIKKEKLIFDNPHTLIDLGGFVKEYAVDQSVKLLKKAKLNSALINFGGDIYALGSKPNGKAFSIGIKNPLNPNEYLTGVEITNQALTTSASYERNHSVEGQRYSHIISSSTMQSQILSATVISSSVLESGVYSTALMIEPSLSTPLKKILINEKLKIIQ
ncbi:MAG: Thiamin biosynthesis lipoprotein ApbE [uncultured Sulfurovum sp.]|uniref:FAD:protein FMN transferase n=1 Tax=uncultured Sulfurovum sp. TaxID=269237 RepID=A0A6S6SQD7_9BACT|nr:MAG: Thiamin biosynthesis lipoprotein ApbE [uncultured Sulfurovum sp.]